MAPRRSWWTTLLLPFVLAAAGTSAVALSPADSCRVPTALDFMLRPPETCSTLDRSLGDPVGVIEGDEVTLAKAVNLLHMNKDDYIAVLFYASWCPFSQECKPNFETLASLFPTIRHFAFEESAIRPSIISRYGIHGFPTLFLLNSTMRVRYHGPRTVKPLAAFYTDVSGINASVKSTSGWDGSFIFSEDSSSCEILGRGDNMAAAQDFGANAFNFGGALHNFGYNNNNNTTPPVVSGNLPAVKQSVTVTCTQEPGDGGCNQSSHATSTSSETNEGGKDAKNRAYAKTSAEAGVNAVGN